MQVTNGINLQFQTSIEHLTYVPGSQTMISIESHCSRSSGVANQWLAKSFGIRDSIVDIESGFLAKWTYDQYWSAAHEPRLLCNIPLPNPQNKKDLVLNHTWWGDWINTNMWKCFGATAIPLLSLLSGKRSFFEPDFSEVKSGREFECHQQLIPFFSICIVSCNVNNLNEFQ